MKKKITRLFIIIFSLVLLVFLSLKINKLISNQVNNKDLNAGTGEVKIHFMRNYNRSGDAIIVEVGDYVALIDTNRDKNDPELTDSHTPPHGGGEALAKYASSILKNGKKI